MVPAVAGIVSCACRIFRGASVASRAILICGAAVAACSANGQVLTIMNSSNRGEVLTRFSFVGFLTNSDYNIPFDFAAREHFARNDLIKPRPGPGRATTFIGIIDA